MNGSRPIRVARVITRLNIGGPARHVTILSTGLGPEFETVLFAGAPADCEGSLVEMARSAGATVVTIPELRRQPAPLADLRVLWRLYREFRRWRPDLVATHTAKAGMLGRVAAALAGVPVRVHTFHGHVLHGYFGSFGSALVRLTERLLDRLTTRSIAISPEIAADLREAGIGRNKTTLIPLGLDLERLADPGPGSLRRQLGLDDGQPLVGLVGRLVPIKAPGLFLDASRRVMESLPAARFVLVGDGELRAELERRVGDEGLRHAVRFTGWRSDLAEVYGVLDLVVCCSINEGTPVSVIEASAAGKPVVGTRVGGMPSVIQHGVTGLLVPPGDPAALAAAMIAILGDRDLAGRMGAAGTAFSHERFGRERMVSQVRDLYLGLLSGALTPSPRAAGGGWEGGVNSQAD
ncbi:MAG: glycosyltransferase family 1 protein [Candidatus Nephthysia bennettiae]|uniref:Glycosyltransferase family 4 protein n=1 Tax=Candidatus Nephthysia bennettiae TaxID=3127016 RepID=A0A934K6D0_9BACT|nr:glycosyltransferase family 4 protein [Candidatus Dormibacteraeota bacterium]PZR99793.1 MAG: glycosyltransferase family 1 protein [Candidatus Dormibacteraeota bacterium]